MKREEPFACGIAVRLKGSGTRGVIEEGPDRKGTYLLAVGAVKMRVPREQLELLPPTRKKAAGKKRRSPTSGGAGAGSTRSLDLHGHTVPQALAALEEALNRALLDDTAVLEIIHGIGSGALRAAVHRYLEASSHIKHFRQPDHNAGTTLAYL